MPPLRRGPLCHGLGFLVAWSLAPAAWGQTPLDRLGALVKDGHITVEADLQPGRIPVRTVWTLEVEGAPEVRIQAEARGGRVETLDFSVQGGRLALKGRGLRPKIRIDAFHFDLRTGITGVRFHGLGIWRPIVATFGGIAKSSISKLKFKTDVPSVLKGEIFEAPPPLPTEAFLDLVREARIVEMTLTPFEGRSVEFPPFLEFHTTAHPEAGGTLTLDVDHGVFRPGRSGAPDFFEFAGRLEGAFEAGTVGFGKDRVGFSRGRIEGGSFHAKSGESGELESAVAASHFSLELSSGHLEVPGGSGDLAGGSRLEVADLRVAPSGLFSGVVDLDLAGRTGVISREGAKLSGSAMSVRTSGLRVTDNRANGQVDVSFDYLLKYPFVVRYPIQEVPEKTVPLEFRGPFVTRLHLSEVGTEGGEVRGEYSFKVPWPPLETAAVEALAAKWTQDVAVIRNVDFTLAPKRFRPCGSDCFLLEFDFTVEKIERGGSVFRQFCEPEGRADLFLDPKARAFILRDVRVQSRCRGVVGWVANLIAPLLAKTYSDTVLFQMPDDLPLTIESVHADADSVVIAGGFDWKSDGVTPLE